MGWIIAILVIFALIIIASSIKIVKEYERGVIFRLGRLLGAKGPGIFFIIPIVDQMQVIDLRVRPVDIPKQNVITRDNVTVDVNAVLYFRVLDPTLAVTKVERYAFATSLLAQTTLRDVLGTVELDTLLSERESLNKSLQEILDSATDPWGIKVTAVTIQGVELPDTMLRAIARQAEAEREKRSRIIIADGELKASKAMSDAAKLYEENPMAMRLRELQTLSDVSKEKNLIVVTQALGDTGSTVALATGISERMNR
ncbi:MAG: FtsH protease regulator HflK [Candidatus Methanolliviera sp. GoM_asphalt]|nr:MAG: FtsH protease regulator HflK [Candidatus Methanolliviera sp. GoM_asphalt]